MTRVTLQTSQLLTLMRDALVAHDTSRDNAIAVAEALLAAEIDGQKGHGLSRLPSYCAQSASGKVDGHARPLATAAGDAAVRIDAANGFAFPAMQLAVDRVAGLARTHSVATAAVFRSHHFGQAGFHVEKLARQGLVGLVMGNSPAAIAPWGGNTALFGTNPIAFAAPRRDDPPLLIDLSLSKVARGKIMVAASKGEAIPEGWAFDAHGRPTTSAEEAMRGTMAPMGDAKGAALVMMVEILAAMLTGANAGFEASSFFEAEGSPPGVGQLLIAFEPERLSAGSFAARLEVLIEAVVAQPGTRLPGERRLQARQQAQRHGIQLDQATYQSLLDLQGG